MARMEGLPSDDNTHHQRRKGREEGPRGKGTTYWRRDTDSEMKAGGRLCEHTEKDASRCFFFHEKLHGVHRMYL
jgi:hypothetical protein